VPRPDITPLHERLRRTALGLDRRNYPREQMRALSELERIERPKWRRRNAKLPSPERVAWYARTLAEVYVAGSGDAVRGMFVDPRVADMAWDYLLTLTDPVAHEAIRQVWLEAPDGKLRELVKDRFPTDVVTLFLLGDFEAYTAVDPSGALLESARAEGDPALRVQLALAARRGKRLLWAYRVAAVPERLLAEEWEALFELLRDRRAIAYLTTPFEPHDLDTAGFTENMPVGNRAVAVSPDGTLTAIGRRNQVRIRRLPTGKTIAHLPLKAIGITEVRTVLIPPAGNTVVVQGRTKQNEWRTLVARLPSGAPIANLAVPTDTQSPPVATPDGHYLAVVESDGLGLWRLPGCTRLETPRVAHSYEPRTSAAITPDSRLLISSGPCHVDLFELPSGRPLDPIDLTNAALTGALLIGTARDGTTAALRYQTRPG
jgi:hypothetical protein